MEIKRVFHEKDKRKNVEEILPQFIAEEYEKSSNKISQWKIQLAKE